MKYYSIQIEAPAEPVVALPVFKRFIRQSHSIDDTILPGILAAATAELEQFLGFSFMPNKRATNIYEGPASLVELDMGPVLSIDSVQYYDRSNTLTVLDPTTYVLQGNVLAPVGHTPWPATATDEPRGYRIEYTAGLIDTSVSPRASLDGRIPVAVMLLAQITYDRNVKDAQMIKDRAYQMVETLRNGQGV